MAFDVLKDIFTSAGKGSPTREKAKGAAISGAGTLLGTALATRKTEADKANIAEIERLQRMQEMGALGLTDQERSMLEQTYGAQLADVAKEGEARRRQQMASYDIFGGAALQQAGLSDAALADARVQAATEIEAADIARRREQEAELQKRLAAEGERVRERRGAFGSLIAKGAEKLSTLPSEKIEEEGQLDPAVVDAVMVRYGLGSRKEAVDYLRWRKSNEEMGKALEETL